MALLVDYSNSRAHTGLSVAPFSQTRCNSCNFLPENLLAYVIGIPALYFQGKVSGEDF